MGAQPSAVAPESSGQQVDTLAALPGRRNDRAAAQKDLWDEALQRLSKEERQVLLESNATSKLDISEDLIQVCEKRRKECQGREW